MSPPAKLLHSSDVFTYSYISLFMLTYPKSSTTHLNGDVLEHLSSLNTFLDRPTPTSRTIIRLRHDLVNAFNERFFPDNNLTIDDSLTLISLFSSLPSLFGLTFPVQFMEDLSIAQDTIATALLTNDSSIKSFFSSLSTHQRPFLTSDILFLFISLLEFLEEHHLPTWHDVFTTVKQTLLHNLFADVYSFPTDLSQNPVSNLCSSDLPAQLSQLLSTNQSFVLITKPFQVTEFGPKAHLYPIFESQLREFFKRKDGTYRIPEEWFKNLLLDTIELLILDTSFRKYALQLVDQKKHSSSNDSNSHSASKISA